MYPKILPEVRGGAQRAEGSVTTFDPINPSTSQNSLRSTPEPPSSLRSFVARLSNLSNLCTHLTWGGLKGQPATSPGQSDVGATPWVNSPHGFRPEWAKARNGYVSMC